jgi:hypothetical protein
MKDFWTKCGRIKSSLPCRVIPYLMPINQSMKDHDVLLRLVVLIPITGDPDVIGWLAGLAGLVAWMTPAARQETRGDGGKPNLKADPEEGSFTLGARWGCRPGYGKLEGGGKNQYLSFSDLRWYSWTSV